MPRRKRNPNQFTTDEAQTATLIYAEGGAFCRRFTYRGRRYTYPAIKIAMCVRQALEPAARVFKTTITREKRGIVTCPPELFPPDGKGVWRLIKSGKPADQMMQRLKPLIPEYYNKKWETVKKKCR